MPLRGNSPPKSARHQGFATTHLSLPGSSKTAAPQGGFSCPCGAIHLLAIRPFVWQNACTAARRRKVRFSRPALKGRARSTPLPLLSQRTPLTPGLRWVPTPPTTTPKTFCAPHTPRSYNPRHPSPPPWRRSTLSRPWRGRGASPPCPPRPSHPSSTAETL